MTLVGQPDKRPRCLPRIGPTWYDNLFITLVVAVAAILACHWLLGRVALPAIWSSTIPIGIGIVAPQIYRSFVRECIAKRERQVIRDALEADLRMCLECGYCLTGLADRGTCPECADTFDIELTRRTWRDYLAKNDLLAHVDPRWIRIDRRLEIQDHLAKGHPFCPNCFTNLSGMPDSGICFHCNMVYNLPMAREGWRKDGFTFPENPPTTEHDSSVGYASDSS